MKVNLGHSGRLLEVLLPRNCVAENSYGKNITPKTGHIRGQECFGGTFGPLVTLACLGLDGLWLEI